MVEWYMGEVTKHHQVMEVVLFDRLRATLHKIDSLHKFTRYPYTTHAHAEATPTDIANSTHAQ